MERSVMIGLLTWPAYGWWLPGPGRGCVDPGALHEADDPLPEPDETTSAERRASLERPVVELRPDQRALVISDLERIAALREFRILGAAAGERHVTLLFDCHDDRDVDRLIQLIKGALSRVLTQAEGDEPARSTSGSALTHHKWWTHHYSFQRVIDPDAVEACRSRIGQMAARGAAVVTP
jgi:REP element-mobilizing transposase RayT